MSTYQPNVMRDRQLALLDGLLVKRFHTVNVLKEQTVGQHSAEALALLVIAYPDSSPNLMKAVLFHDLMELCTGDTPAPVKQRSAEVKATLDSMEDEGYQRAFGTDDPFPKLSDEDNHRLKFVDRLSGLLTCVREMSMGNRGIEYALRNFTAYIAALPLTDHERAFAAASVRSQLRFSHIPSGVEVFIFEAISGKMAPATLKRRVDEDWERFRSA